MWHDQKADGRQQKLKILVTRLPSQHTSSGIRQETNRDARPRLEGSFVVAGEPDPAMLQFLRLAHLGGKDAFLLESIFRKEIWGFMSEPVSEDNERGAMGAVIEACRSALEEMDEATVTLDAVEGSSPSSEKRRLCSMVGESERDALERTLAYVRQEAEALDLKEYYQERRLKSLGLDSDWTPEDDIGFGGTRVPGGADYDW